MEKKIAAKPEAILEKLSNALETRPKLTNDSILAAIIMLVSALHKVDGKDEYMILQYYATLNTLLENYDIKFINGLNDGESFFISIDLFLKLLKHDAPEIKAKSLTALKNMLNAMQVDKVRFAFPALTIGLVKVIATKKNPSALKAHSLELLKDIILTSIADNSTIVKDLIKEIEESEHTLLVNSIKAIGGSSAHSPENEVSVQAKPPKKFTVNMDKKWLVNTGKKLNTVFKKILNSISLLDFAHVSLRNALIGLCVSSLKHCAKSFQKSTILLLKLLFIPYFMENTNKASFKDFSSVISGTSITSKVSLQDELIKSIVGLKQVLKEADSQQQRNLVCICIGFSWTIQKAGIIPVLSESQLMSIHDSFNALLEFNKVLIIEVIEALPSSSIPSSLAPERMSFLTKCRHGNLMKMLKHFTTNQPLWTVLESLISTLPEPMRISLFNYTLSLVDFEQIPAKESDLERVCRALILLKTLAKGLREPLYKLGSGVVGLAGAKTTFTSSSNAIENLTFVICECLNEAISNDDLIRQMKPQEQNKLILLLFEFLSSPHQNVRLNAEYAYVLLCQKIESTGTNVIEDRYPALIDLLLQKVNYFYFETKTESALHIISTLIERTPALFERCVGTILESLIRCFDKYFQEEFLWIIEHFMPIFVKVLKYGKARGKEKKDLIVSTNIIRQILLRIKPLLGSHKNSLVVAAYIVFKESLEILSKRPMEREEAANFSSEDPDNVSIPNSLTAIFFEFWPAILYQFNTENNLPILNECLKICGKVAAFSPEFFKTMDRFELELWPRVKRILGKHMSNQLFLTKTQFSAVNFLEFMVDQGISEAKVKEVVETIFRLMCLREEDKDVIVSAYAERLVQLKDKCVGLMQKAAKTSNDIIIEKCKQELAKNTMSKPEHKQTSILAICSSFIREINETI